jgi:hypothetical protein
MASTNLDQIVTHMQFLGYQVERDGDIVKARHQTKVNILLRDFRGGVLLTSIFGCQDAAKKNRLGYLDFINQMNQKAVIIRFYADKDSDFFMEAWFPGAYDRAVFGSFLELWDEDVARLSQAEAEKFLS